MTFYVEAGQRNKGNINEVLCAVSAEYLRCVYTFCYKKEIMITICEEARDPVMRA